MKTHLFTEASNTTAEDAELPLKEYYKGLFRVVAGLYDDLEELTDAQLHILSEEFGEATGAESMSSVTYEQQSPVGFEEMVQDAQNALINTVSDSDIMIILFSTSVFDAIIPEIWDEIVDAAKPESIWCLSAARSSLEAVDIEKLLSKGCTVLTYHRVGVAQIDTDTQEELLKIVNERISE